MVKVPILEFIMKTCHIMVVDHNALLVETIVDCLRTQGYESAEGMSYAKALAILKESPAFTILIVHVHNKEGATLLDEARHIRPGLPILAIVSTLVEDVNVSSNAGYSLHTPFDLEMLLAAVATCIASSPEMDESRIWPPVLQDSQEQLDERLRDSQF
jgi:DNA-binding response OmpR family regulator